MTVEEKTIWNRKHSERSHSTLTPDPLLVSAYDEFLANETPGTALDIAGGIGRHAVWLAERGWRVKLIDISNVGIQQAQKNAKHTKTDGRIVTEIRDLDGTQKLGREQYDLVLVFFFLQRELFPALMAALKPGGYLIYKTYTTEQKRFTGGPSHPMFLLEPNELLHAFSAIHILHYHETTQGKGIAELVARKHGNAAE